MGEGEERGGGDAVRPPGLTGARPAEWPFRATLSSPPEAGWQLAVYSTGVALLRKRSQTTSGPERLRARMPQLFATLDGGRSAESGGMTRP